VGDDSRHLPLRITAVTEVGALRADLIVVPTKPRWVSFRSPLSLIWLKSSFRCPWRPLILRR